jgi:hypothetical protein
MSQFFAAGGVPIQYSTNTSGSFTTPVSGKYLITAIGGGGGGGGGGAYRGGGGGGLAQSLVSLSYGVVLTLTVGAGGAGGYPGTAGGTTTVSGSGITTLTANGGAISTGTGGAGGTASGGNIMNVTGGSAGNGDYFGGGAVGVYGTTPAASSVQYAGASVTGALVGVEHTSDGFLGGRLLQPLGGIYYYWWGDYGRQITPHPGQGGMSGSGNGFAAQAGLFAGGGYSGAAGKFGGGGFTNYQGYAVAGGVGGVIIEYFLA